MSKVSLFWLLAALAAGWLLSGCSTSSNDTPPTARSPRAASERIAGAWQGMMLVDDEAVAGKLSQQQVAQLASLEMGMEFREDGSLLLTGLHNGEPYTSHNQWKVLREGDDEVTIRSIEPSGAQKEIVLVFEGDDVFLLPMKTEVAELGAMRFERLR